MSRVAKQEVDLVRLLRCAEGVAESVLQQRVEAPFSIKTFQKFVTALQTKLEAVEVASQQPSLVSADSSSRAAINLPSLSSNVDALADYRRRIDFLANLIGSHQFMKALSSGLAAGSSTTLTFEGISSQSIRLAVMTESRRQLGVQGPAQTPVEVPSDTAAAQIDTIPLKTATTVARTPKRLTTATESVALMEEQKRLQDEFTDEMLEFTSKLKQNAITTNRIVSDQIHSLGKLESKLDQNTDAASIANQALKELFESSSGSTWFHWSIMMLATLMFAGMYIFMKIFPKTAPQL